MRRPAAREPAPHRRRRAWRTLPSPVVVEARRPATPGVGAAGAGPDGASRRRARRSRRHRSHAAGRPRRFAGRAAAQGAVTVGSPRRTPAAAARPRSCRPPRTSAAAPQPYRNRSSLRAPDPAGPAAQVRTRAQVRTADSVQSADRDCRLDGLGRLAGVLAGVLDPGYRSPAGPAADAEAATIGLARIAPALPREQPVIDPPGLDDEPPPRRVPVASSKPRRRRKLWLIVGGVVGVVAALYLVDLLTGTGRIPRATTVAGVEVGGMSHQAAEEQLHAELDPRQAGPVPVHTAEVTTTIDPKAAGLSLDWPATLERAKAQPLNPITRLMTLFSDREVGIVTISDGEKLDGVLQGLQPVVDRPVAEGNVRFEGLRPIPVDPVPGRALDIPAASGLLVSGTGSRRRGPAADERARPDDHAGDGPGRDHPGGGPGGRRRRSPCSASASRPRSPRRRSQPR